MSENKAKISESLKDKASPKNFKKNPIKGTKFTIMVSSAKGGVGKSTFAMNFALALKSTGSKVGTAKAGTAGEGGQVSMQNLSNQLAINPATVQVRQERKVIDTKPKGGGGRKDFAQAGGSRKDKIDEVFKILNDKIS